MDKRLSGLKRIMFMIPVLLGIMFSLVMVIQYTRIEEGTLLPDSGVMPELGETFDEMGIPGTDELSQRGQELLEQYGQAGNGDPVSSE